MKRMVAFALCATVFSVHNASGFFHMIRQARTLSRNSESDLKTFDEKLVTIEKSMVDRITDLDKIGPNAVASYYEGTVGDTVQLMRQLVVVLTTLGESKLLKRIAGPLAKQVNITRERLDQQVIPKLQSFNTIAGAKLITVQTAAATQDSKVSSTNTLATAAQ